ncbi:MAG TPA: aminoglycoside phosphotransferase family protein, partial [Pseudonocardiaceae bacterium]|nr:aminoglycoside phosphotransferase family protein [Pseudonocardiaceae bacterium]
MTSRPRWADVPPDARAAVETLVGAPVTGSRGTAGGFTGSLAEIVTCRDGRRWFVKGSGRGAEVYRREHDIVRALPPGLPVPACRGLVDAGGWTLLVFEAVAGQTVTEPWQDDTLAAALDSVRQLYDELTPAPVTPALPVEVALRSTFSAWRERPDWADDLGLNVDLLARLESEWPAYAHGDCLLHCDLRADNMIVDRDGRVWVVDWPSAVVGAPFFDVVIFLVTVAVDGRHDPESWLRGYGLADEPGVNAILAAAAGYWFRSAR